MLETNAAAVVESRGRSWDRADRIIGIGERAVDAAGDTIAFSAQAERGGILRVEPYGAVQVGECLVHMIEVEVHASAFDQRIDQRLGVILGGGDHHGAGGDTLLGRNGAVVTGGADVGVDFGLGIGRRPGQNGKTTEREKPRQPTTHGIWSPFGFNDDGRSCASLGRHRNARGSKGGRRAPKNGEHRTPFFLGAVLPPG